MDKESAQFQQYCDDLEAESSDADVAQQIKEDMEFLLHFVPAMDPSQVEPDLMNYQYITGYYDDDVKIVERIADIIERNGLTPPDEELEDIV